MEGEVDPRNVVKGQLDRLIKPSKRMETQVLDYSSQQYLLFPQLALSFALGSFFIEMISIKDSTSVS